MDISLIGKNQSREETQMPHMEDSRKLINELVGIADQMRDGLQQMEDAQTWEELVDGVAATLGEATRLRERMVDAATGLPEIVSFTESISVLPSDVIAVQSDLIINGSERPQALIAALLAGVASPPGSVEQAKEWAKDGEAVTYLAPSAALQLLVSAVGLMSCQWQEAEFGNSDMIAANSSIAAESLKAMRAIV